MSHCNCSKMYGTKDGHALDCAVNKHLVLHRSEFEVLYARIANHTASFPSIMGGDVKQYRDAFIWAAKIGAVTWEHLYD